jgi:hypothetical protein
VTILTVTTMPGDDVTHPVPDNTGYITEGQFYLHDGVLDPFGSLSRLKQHVIGKVTREDHNQIMNTMIRFYSGARDAEQKQAMAFELSDYDHQAAEVRRAVPGALHGHRRLAPAGGGARPVLADPGGVLRAGAAADEAGADRQVFSETETGRHRLGRGSCVMTRRSAQHGCCSDGGRHGG